MKLSIVSTGRSVPARVLRNRDLAGMVETSDEWIRERTGMSERRILTTETMTEIMAEAAEKALEAAGMSGEELELIVVATFTPDSSVPSAAANVRKRLGIDSCVAFDVNAACTGFIYGLCVARGLMETMGYRAALVIGGEALSRLVDWEDRSTCVLFGDGAGAAVLRADAAHGAFLAAHLEGETDEKGVLSTAPLYKKNPFSAPKAEGPGHFIAMSGQAVFRFAVNAMCRSVKKVLEKAGIGAEDVTWVVPHQANIRIIEFAIKKLGIPRERYMINLERYGNTSAASVPLALDELFRSGKMKRGDKVVLTAFGGGLTAGALLFEY